MYVQCASDVYTLYSVHVGIFICDYNIHIHYVQLYVHVACIVVHEYYMYVCVAYEDTL